MGINETFWLRGMEIDKKLKILRIERLILIISNIQNTESLIKVLKIKISNKNPCRNS